MKRIRVIIPHPHIKPHHVKHTAAGMTVGGGLLEVFSTIPHLGTVLLVLAGCIAIYEPHLVHDVAVAIDEDGETI